jgi:hypothetical protein
MLESFFISCATKSTYPHGNNFSFLQNPNLCEIGKKILIGLNWIDKRLNNLYDILHLNEYRSQRKELIEHYMSCFELYEQYLSLNNTLNQHIPIIDYYQDFFKASFLTYIDESGKLYVQINNSSIVSLSNCFAYVSLASDFLQQLMQYSETWEVTLLYNIMNELNQISSMIDNYAQLHPNKQQDIKIFCLAFELIESKTLQLYTRLLELQLIAQQRYEGGAVNQLLTNITIKQQLITQQRQIRSKLNQACTNFAEQTNLEQQYVKTYQSNSQLNN